MIAFLQEMALLGRRLLRTPSFTFLTAATLALGIGASAAIFTVVSSVLIRPLPYPAQERLHAVWHTAPGMGVDRAPHSEATYLLYATENRVFDGFGIYQAQGVNVTGDGQPERVRAMVLTHELLPLLGVVPGMGRLTREPDDLPDSPRVVMLTHGFWQRRFGGDPGIVGRTLEVGGMLWEIVGVLPAGFSFPGEEAEIFLPLRIDRGSPDEGSFNYAGLARVRDGVREEVVLADMRRMIDLIPEFSGSISRPMLEQMGLAPRVAPLKEDMVGEVSRTLWMLLAAVGLVFLIACANVANLFLVRAEGRLREVAVRTAMGASGADLARHFLTESVALGMMGGAAGLFLAWGGTRALVAHGPENLPRLHEIGMDAWVLLFALALSVLAGVLFGLFPLLRHRGSGLVAGLKEGGRGGGEGRERHRARNALVVSQVALALLLLVGSGLMLRSFQSLRNVDPGFEPAGVLTFRLTLPAGEYPDRDTRLAFHQTLHDGLSASPGVVSVGAGSNVPMGGQTSQRGTWFEDFPLSPDQPPTVVETARVTAGYLETLGARLLEGRMIDSRDALDRTGAVVVTRALAERYWPGGSAIGKRLSQDVDFGREVPGEDGLWQTIVGVVENVRSMGMDREPGPIIYIPLVQALPDHMASVPQTLSYAVRTSDEPTALLPAVRQTVWALDPNLPLAEVQTLESVVGRSMARTSFTAVLLGIAALVALLLGVVGIYGVISYVVSQRTREIGVRMALGAEEGTVAAMVLRQGAALAGAGIVLGTAAAFGLTRLMEALLYGVSATDPVTFGGVAAALALAALMASYVPARRAARTDPVEALRSE